jgi:hypothetical protein
MKPEMTEAELDLLFEQRDAGFLMQPTKDCPSLAEVAAFFDQVILDNKSGNSKLASHTRTCSWCQAALQDLARAHSQGASFVLNQPAINKNSAAMARESGAAALPSYLEHYTRENLPSQPEESEGILSLVVRMTRESFQVIHNGLSGVSLSQAEGIALRGPSEYPSYTLEQQIPMEDSSSGTAKIQYKVFRETDDEVMLSVKLDEDLKSQFNYIKLKREDRVISSQQVNQTKVTIFNHLKHGNYLVELLGESQLSLKMALV